MFHHVAHAVPGRLLFRDAIEAHRLWHAILRAVPGPTALCLMPNHIHLVCAESRAARVGRALSGFVRWRNARSGETGRLIARSPEPESIIGETKLRRQIRYVHLNPCRAHLVQDPIAWPYSTHLDAVGLASPAVRKAYFEPHRLHAYISADPAVSPDGTELPVPPGRLLSLDEVLTGVTAAMRTPAELLLQRRAPGRQLLLECARGMTRASSTEIAGRFGCSRSSVQRVRPVEVPLVAALGTDPRLAGWEWTVERAASRWRTRR